MAVTVDATNKILGRMASHVAVHALKGEEVIVYNAEKAVISGNEDSIKEKFLARVNRGDIIKGPFISKLPDRIVRRVIRGMLPWDTARGRAAFKRITVLIGKPSEIKGTEMAAKGIDASILKNQKYTTIQEICEYLGRKV